MSFLTRDGKKRIRFATDRVVTLDEIPRSGQAGGEPCTFQPHAFRGDATLSYLLTIHAADGTVRTYAVEDNDVDTILIAGTMTPVPSAGQVAAIHVQYKVPKVDTALCIGCGLCEVACPVTGDRRAVYVTADGETRSMHYGDADRNRSLRLTGAGDSTIGK